MTKLNSTIAVVAAAGLALAGCTATPTTGTSPVATAPQTSAAVTETESPAADATTGTNAADDQARNDAALAAITTAEGAVNGRAIDLEWEDDAWEIDVRVAEAVHELRIAADGGSVVRTDDKPDTLDAGEIAALDAATVSMADAVTTALAQRPGRLDDVEFDEDNAEWEVEITVNGDSADVLIDAATGAVKN